MLSTEGRTVVLFVNREKMAVVACWLLAVGCYF